MSATYRLIAGSLGPVNPATQCINETVLYIASGCLALHSVLFGKHRCHCGARIEFKHVGCQPTAQSSPR